MRKIESPVLKLDLKLVIKTTSRPINQKIKLELEAGVGSCEGGSNIFMVHI